MEVINYANMANLGEENNAQNRRDQKDYHAWRAKDTIAHGILISTMVDDFVDECKQFSTAQEMWVHLKEKFGGITMTRLR